MNKNIKRMFFVTTLLILLVGLSTISAADASNDTASTKQQDVVKEVNVEKVSDNTITDTTTKNIKKEEQTTDLYVSDTDGSDENSGTNNSPYKTIQKALDTTNSDSTFNIHIAEGTYKGLGNTNLTVNGNYNINIIGEGNAVIDGEAKYDIKQELLPGEYFWDSSSQWYPYANASGNYAMNITTGTGTIKISNITIQNCYSEGIDSGDSIDKYPFTTVDNYANLIVDNVSFIDNCAGVGGAIRNNHDSTLTVNNSLFKGNRKSTSSGNDGGAIYNNGTATINNSTFQENYSRWGTILNDAKLTINNSIIRDNKEYDGTSTYKFGAGIAADTGKADFFKPYTVTGIETIIDNCTFINNGQTDVYHGDGYLLINNSHFANSTGIYILANDTTGYQEITNNQILDSVGSSLFSSLSVTTSTTFGINARLTPNILIQNNTLTSKNGNSIQIVSNATIINNTMNNPIEVNGNNTLIENNNINTSAMYTVNIAAKTNNHTIINNNLESSLLYGNKAVNATTATIENNTPELGQDITITDETYNQYFNDNGTIKDDTIEQGSSVTLQGDFNNKKFIIDQHHITIKATGTLYNSTFTVKDNARINAANININNINTTDNYALLIETENNIFTGLNINVNSITPTHGIIIKADNNEISGSVTIRGPSNPITNERGLTDTMALDIQSSNNIITNANINAYSNENYTNGTITAINIQSIDKEANNNTLYNVGARAQYGENLYAIRIVNSSSNIIFEQTTMYSIRAEYGLKKQVGIFITEKSDNNQIQKTDYMYISSYGLYTLDEEYGIIINGTENTINNTTINNTNTLSLILHNTQNTNIDNFVSNSQNNKTGIQITNSTNTNINNTILSSIKTGILINNSINTTVTNSNINTEETIILNNSIYNTIKNNYLNINNTWGGDETVTIINSTNNIIENNTPIIIRLTDNNYNNYFNDASIYNYTSSFIILSSNLYNKNLTIPRIVTFINPGNYSIYNGTLSLIENAAGSNITGLKFYANDERTTIIYSNVTRCRYENLTIEQYNKDNIVKTIVLDNKVTYNTFLYNNITVTGPEIKTNDNTSSLILFTRQYGNQNRLSLSNITLQSTKIDNDGFIVLLEATNEEDLASPLYFMDNNILITGNNVLMANSRSIDIQNSNITINANEVATLYKSINSDSIQIRNNTIEVNSNNTTVLYDIEFANVFMSYLSDSNNIIINSPNSIIANINNTIGSLSLTGTLNLTTNNLTIIKINNGSVTLGINISDLKTEKFNMINSTNSTVTLINNNINATVTENNGIILTNNSVLTSYNFMNGNLINIKSTNSTPFIRIINSVADIQKTNITQNSSNTPIIKSIDSNITVKNNYLETLDLTGDNTVETINSTYTIENNTPSNTGYKVIIDIETIDLPEHVTTQLPITVTNTFGETIQGIITAKFNDNEVTVKDNIAYILPTKQTFNPPTTTFINNYENQTITTPTKLQSNTNINNTIFEITDQVMPNANNALATWSGKIYLINNTIMNAPIFNRGTTYIYNSILNGTYRANTAGLLYVDDNTIIGDNFKLYPENMKIFTNNKQLLEILKQNNLSPVNTPTVTITYADPTGKYTATSITKNITTTLTELTIDPITATVGQTVNITARITADNETITDINKGKVTFKVNGKTLKDANGKVIYAKVVNGTATIENYEVPDDWAKDGTTIQAVYSGSTQCDKLTSEKTNITVAKAVPTLTTDDVTATAGGKITLKATITDNDKVINTGKIVFKINGKTVKDENGKVIYAKVVNSSVEFEYTLPESYKVGSYNITATFISADYDRLTDSKTLTVN